MNILSSFSEIINNAKKGISRFPITLLWAVLGTFYTIWFIDQKISHNLEFSYIKIILTGILGVSWLIATRLLVIYFKEETNQNKSWLMAIPILFLVIYYFTLPNTDKNFSDLTIPYRFALFLITGHLLIFFTPFLFKWDKKAYWNYLKNIFTSFATSAIFSIVLYLGLTIAMMALRYLFKFEIKSIRHFELFIFCLGIINTWIFLSDLPKNMTKEFSIKYPKALLVFVKYILIPLTILYLVILYAYSFKILVNWNLPKGWVSYLVVALSILGFLIHILINPIRKTTESSVIRKFYPWFYYALLPMIVLLFVAIFKRIADYGITENRYLVLLLAFWILGMTLYLLISKRKKLIYFPLSVAILTLLVSFGFWGVFNVSEKSQANQFKKLYAKIKMADFKVDYQDKDRLSSLTNYLQQRNALSKISDAIGFDPAAVFNDASKWEMTSKIIDSLNLKVTNMNTKKNRFGFHFYNTNNRNRNKMVAIKGYDYLKNVNLSGYTYPMRVKHVDNSIEKYSFKLDTTAKSNIIVVKEKDTIHTIKLAAFLKSLELLQENGEITQEKLTFSKQYDDLNIKILFHNIEVNSMRDEKIIPSEINNAFATILIKEKN